MNDIFVEELEESEVLSLFPTNTNENYLINDNTYKSSGGDKLDCTIDCFGNNINPALELDLLNTENKAAIDEILLGKDLGNLPDTNNQTDSEKDFLTGEERDFLALPYDSLLGGNSNDLLSNISAVVKPEKSAQEQNNQDDILAADSSIIQRRSVDSDLNIVNNPNLTLEATLSNNQDINSLIQGTKWNLNYLDNQITYSFIEDFDYYNEKDYTNNDGNVYSLNDSGKNTVRNILDDLEKIIPVDFKEVSYSLDDPAIIVFVGVEIPDETEAAGYASYPSYYYHTGGDVRLDLDYQDNYYVVAHEVGHALGLKHSGAYSEHDDSPFLLNSEEHTDTTVMSYNLAPSGKYPTEYKPLDIQALQHLYGSNETAEITPEVSISNVSITEGNKGTKKALFQVTLDQADDEIVTVEYTTVNGSAEAGSDYREKSGTVTFKPGQTTKNINIPIIGDKLVESKENFFVELNNPTNAEIADGKGKGIIKNNDKNSSSSPLVLTTSEKYPTEYNLLEIKALEDLSSSNEIPEISISNVKINEGNKGTKKARFKVTLDQAQNDIVTVEYTTINGSAEAGSDYREKSGTVTFKPGQTTKNINIPIIGDKLVESKENFFVELNNPTNAEIADGKGKGIIKNNDKNSSSIPLISIRDVEIVEGDDGIKKAKFKVRLDRTSNSPIKVDYQTVEATSVDSAIPGVDYQSKSGTITFKPNQRTKTIKVPIYGDSLEESDDYFWVFLNNPESAKIKDKWGLATIKDND